MPRACLACEARPLYCGIQASSRPGGWPRSARARAASGAALSTTCSRGRCGEIRGKTWPTSSSTWSWERRARGAEAVDRLRRVAQPDQVLGELAEGQEEGELDGGGVLELVDREQPEPGADRGAGALAAAQHLQGEHLLVDEVHQPQLVL